MNISDKLVQNLISLMVSAFPKNMSDEQLDEFIRHFFDNTVSGDLVDEIKKRYTERDIG